MFGCTALMYAAEQGDSAMTVALLEAEGIDVNAVGDGKDWTALMVAAKHGHTTVGQLLLAVDGIDVNATNEDGWTAIMWAAKHGHLGMMAALLAIKGVDVNGAARSCHRPSLASVSIPASASIPARSFTLRPPPVLPPAVRLSCASDAQGRRTPPRRMVSRRR